jgi:hypothetical protein
MLKQVDAEIAAAQAAFDKNNNQENYIALLEATQEREAVLAQIEGFRSEQLSNDLALQRELIELSESEFEAANERAISEAEFRAEQIEGEYLRLEALKAVAIEEARLEAAANTALKGSPPPFNFIAAAATVAAGIANVKQITASKEPSLPSFASSSGGSISTPSIPTPPQINTVGTSGVNQLAETINAQTKQPIKAFVVAGEVTTAQSLERNAVREASI